MSLTAMGPLAVTLFASLVIAVILLALRVLVMGRVQTQRQRENRQETERLKSLAAAYRSMAGSFSPAAEADRMQLEEALADIVLFGSLPQVEEAAACATALVRGEPVNTQPLVEALRADLRVQLGLDPIPDSLLLPHSGPGRSLRVGRDGEGRGGGRGPGGGGGGGGVGGGGGGAAAGGVGLGLVVGSEGGLARDG
jgi:uncharacterized membrane protein YgcG